MPLEVKIPEVGESITEGILAEWCKADGDWVEAEEPLLELETDKITMTVDAEAAGRLEILVPEGATVQVGLGPSQYREEQGFVLNVGDQVVVTGYWEDDEFKALMVENLDQGTEIVLRDPAGRPMWSGQGRRSGS